MAIKFRKFWKINPAEKVHNTKKRKDTNITEDDLKVYVECSDCGGKGFFNEVIKLENGVEKHNMTRCEKCYGLGEVDSGQVYGESK